VEKQVATVSGYFANTAAYIFKSAGDFLYKLGLIGAATGMASRYAVGYAMIHPGYFVTAIISSVAVQYGAGSLQKASVLSHIDVITDHFSTVTSNLKNQYFQASELVSNSFLVKNPMLVHEAISALIEG